VQRSLDTVDFALDPMPGPELHDVLRAYRERAPVMPTRFFGLPAFVITGYAALADAFQDTKAFPPHRMYQSSFEPAIGKSFIPMEDEKQHRLYRKLATPAFRSRAVASYEREGLASLAHELVDRFADRSPVDLIEAFAARFPYLVITRLLGLPRDREDEFHGWALSLLRFRDDPEQARRGGEELTRFLAPVVEARRSEPRNDVISELVHATVEGRSLSDEEIASHVRLLFPTGGETTHGALGNLFYALLTQGDAWSRVREDPARAAAAVEESLRWETPIAVLPRMSCSQPIEFDGVDIPSDSWVLFAIAGANRDPAVFPDPDRFDLGREPQGALTFGRGVKSCPGMHLARRNMTVALQVLVERMPQLEIIDREEAAPRRSVLRSPDALWVQSVGA
jgi:cytochrome P450